MNSAYFIFDKVGLKQQAWDYSPQLRRTFLFARLRAAIDFFLPATLGFSKCSRFLTSERIPAFSQDFLNLRNAPSKLSPSRTLTNATVITGLPRWTLE